MTLDLFGREEAPRYTQPDLAFEEFHSPSMRQVLAELHERTISAEQRARLRPDDEVLATRAAQARKDFLQLRDYARTMSIEEWAAEVRLRTRGL